MSIKFFFYKGSLFYFSALLLTLIVDLFALVISVIFPHTDFHITQFLISLTYIEFSLLLPFVLFFFFGRISSDKNTTQEDISSLNISTDPHVKKENGWGFVSKILGVLIIILTLSMVPCYYLGAGLIISFFILPCLILLFGMFLVAASLSSK